MNVTVEVQVGYEFDGKEAAMVLAKFDGDQDAVIHALMDNSREVIQAGTGKDDVVVNVQDVYDLANGGLVVVVYGNDSGDVSMGTDDESAIA